MTRDVMLTLSMPQLERAINAYSELRDVYEELADGVHAAYNYKEYAVICSTLRSLDSVKHEKIAARYGNGN